MESADQVPHKLSSTKLGQLPRGSQSGLWDVILEAVNETGEGQDSVQMIDSTIVRAHQHSAGAKRGVRTKVLAARAAASRPKST